MSLALPTCVLLISHMQSVNGAQFLNITFLLFVTAGAAAVFSTVIVHLTKIDASLESNKPCFIL